MERPSGRWQLVLAAWAIALRTAVALPGSGESFEIALPEAEGPVTIAVFSADGRRIRTLCRDADVAAMQPGLNGLIMSWDGRDDADDDAPQGRYRVRGLVHGRILCDVMPFKGTNDTDPPAWTLSAPFPPDDRIVLRASRDALYEKPPPVSIRVAGRPGAWSLEADGIPLLTLPGGILPGEGKAFLKHGPTPGTALFSLGNGRNALTVQVSGLESIVPLDAGWIELPSRASHSAADPGESPAR
jgi:hypothetical protein